MVKCLSEYGSIAPTAIRPQIHIQASREQNAGSDFSPATPLPNDSNQDWRTRHCYDAARSENT